VNLSNSITTSDALLILRVGVGQIVSVSCPSASERGLRGLRSVSAMACAR
jgi:hypothetical protein